MSLTKKITKIKKIKKTKLKSANKTIKHLIKYKSNNNNINIDYKNKYIILLTKLLQTQNDLIIKYYDFWQNIYYNDTYVFYKQSIMFMKNQQNSKYHDFFSGFISKILWNGKCDYMITEDPDWISKNSLRQPEPSAFCKVGIEMIHNLDEMFKSICPKLNNHLTVYRGEDLPLNSNNTQALIKSNAGDYIRFNNYLPTTVNYNYTPVFFCSCRQSINAEHTEKEKKEIDNPNICELCNNNEVPILYIMELPENTTGYYYNIPFAPLPNMASITIKTKNGMYIGQNEYEFVLPRGCIFEIISNKIDFTRTRRIIHIKLIKQLKEYTLIKEGETNTDLNTIFKKNEKLPKEYNNAIDLNKYHVKNYHIDTAFYDYMNDNYDIKLFISKLKKILPCKNIENIKKNKYKSLIPFYKSLQKPNFHINSKYYLCLNYFDPITELFMKLHHSNMNDEIKISKFLYYVISSDISFALLNSLILLSIYNETTGKKNNNVKVAEHFGKLDNDIELFYLLEIDNINTFNENIYKINDTCSILTTMNKEINTQLCEPNNSIFFGDENVRDTNLRDCKFIINSTNINTINNFKYKHIKCDLKIL
jgi:hypothetical protein